MPDTGPVLYRQTIIFLADRFRLPTIYPLRVFITDGGLIYYGIDFPEMFGNAASYVDRCVARNRINFQFNSQASLS
jgi:putative ABC transport system substrate-binding protein